MEDDKDDKKSRTHSCSSIPYDNIIENLAPFRKRLCNIQLFTDTNEQDNQKDNTDDGKFYLFANIINLTFSLFYLIIKLTIFLLITFIYDLNKRF